MMAKPTLTDILNRLDSKQAVQQWKEVSAKNIKKFAESANPFDIRPSGYYLYIDTDSMTYSVVLRGVKPNAGAAKGYQAPVRVLRPLDPMVGPANVGSQTGRIYRWVGFRWGTTQHLGSKPLKPHYFGTSGELDSYFGVPLKRYEKIYGLDVTEHVSVPIYSKEGLVEFITEDNRAELDSIMIQAGFKVMAGVQTERWTGGFV